MKPFFIKYALLLFLGLLLVGILTVYASIAAGTIAPAHLYNADTLSIPAMYDDLVSGYSLRGWHFGPASSLFPDLPLYLLLRFLTGSLQWATVTYGCAQILLYVFGLLWLSTEVCGSRTVVRAWMLGGGAALCFVMATGQANGLLPVLLNSFHFGTALAQIAALIIAVRILRIRAVGVSIILHGVGLGALTTAMLLSDALYVVQALLPVLIGLALLFLLAKITPRAVLTIYLALVLPIFINPYLTRVIHIYRQAAGNDAEHAALSVSRLAAQIATTFQSIWQWPQAGWFSQRLSLIFLIVWGLFVLVCLSVAARLIVQSLRERQAWSAGARRLRIVVLFGYGVSVLMLVLLIMTGQRAWLAAGTVLLTVAGLLLATRRSDERPFEPDGHATPLLLVLAVFLISCAANLASAGVVGVNLPRYFLPTLLIPLFFGWAFLIGSQPRLMRWLEHPCRLTALAGGVLAIGLLTGASAHWRQIPMLPQLGAYYSDFVRCLDDQARSLGLRNGLAQYWDAKYISMLSRAHLHVAPARISPRLGLVPEHFISNLNWQNQDFDFIVTQTAEWEGRSLWPDKIRGQFGEPAAAFACQDDQGLDRAVFVYNRQEDGAFQQIFRKYFAFRSAAADLPSETGERAGTSRIAKEGRDRAGYLTYGPYVNLPVGDYAFEIRYSAQGSDDHAVGRWDLLVHPPEGLAQSSLLDGVLPVGTNRHVTGTVRIRQLGKTELRTYYAGQGTLQVDAIRLWRIR